jgi:hypothetical protein
VRRELFAAARLLALPTLGVVGVAIVAPGRAELALRIYALAVSATAIAVLVAALRRAYPDETPLREPSPPARKRAAPPSLGRIEHEMALGAASSFDLHFRLVPRLRSVAGGLLRARRSSSLSDAGARDVLGDDAWALVRPDRPAPEDRLTKGSDPEDLDRVVRALEAI